MGSKGSVKVDDNSFRMTIIALGSTKVDAKRAAALGINAAGVVLLHRVKVNASRTDHTLEDLRRLGHPYARRHGQIRTSALGPDFVKRPYLVHKRSGSFQGSFSGKMVGGSNPAFDVSARPTVPWVRYVILGTRVMLPRDIIWQTAQERATRIKMMKAVVHVLGKGLRLQAAVRFSGIWAGGTRGAGQ